MSKILVLAEKPSVARSIAKVLKCQKKGLGFIEGSKYIITWALGHLVTLANPESYNLKYKQWNIIDLPIIPHELKLEVIKDSRKQFGIVKNQMYRSDVEEIVIATDAGREGELVARWIIEKTKINKKIKRLWISSVTDKAILEGFKNLKDGKLYENLYHSAKSRAFADWYVGINATRALTTKYNTILSCGRVQTPTLQIIAKREEEINKFKPQTFYSIKVTSQNINFSWQNNNRIFDRKICENIVNTLKGKKAIIKNINKTNKRYYAPNLYDLTELQRDANRIYNFSAKETLSIMQRLYEYHKILTYPRTDSKYITTDIVPTLKERLEAIKVSPYLMYVNNILAKEIKVNKSFVDDSKVTDHHAIIPTEEKVNLSRLTDKEIKIYDLVVKRFLAVLYPPHEYEQAIIDLQIQDEKFIAKGKKIINNGWKDIYNYQEDEINEYQLLPNFHSGEELKIDKIEVISYETQAPSPFTEGTLLQVMENPVKYMDSSDKSLVKTISETGGLGTVATRADIIEKLYNTSLIEKRGKNIYITSKGKQLLDLVPYELKSPILTALWEQKLIQIAQGKLKDEIFIKEMKNYAKNVVKQIIDSEKTFKHDNLTTKECPNCGKLLLEVKIKDKKLLVCQDRKCNYRKTISKMTNNRCPVCHKLLELYGDGENQIYICKCGHKEKLVTFNERMKKEKNKLSKKDISKYMNQINKESDVLVNTSLLDALKDFYPNKK